MFITDMKYLNIMKYSVLYVGILFYFSIYIVAVSNGYI